jgi:tetratricopeptide (TPR) repeat protein
VLKDETSAPSAAINIAPTPGTSDGLTNAPLSQEVEMQIRVATGRVRDAGFLGLLRSMSYTDAVCWIGEQLANGLAHAHDRGLVHNDLKPANILLTDDGQPMLLDFGMADDLTVRSSNWGAIGGTLSYMSPEHLEAVRTRTPGTDHRSDIYALGIILYECLTGQPPYRHPTGTMDQEVPRMIEERRTSPPSIRLLNPAVSSGFEAIIRKCLEVDPARRYQSALDLKEDLERHRLHAPLRYTRVPSLRERVSKWTRRHPRLASHASVISAVLVLIGICAGGLQARNERLKRLEAAEISRQLDDDIMAASSALNGRVVSRNAVETGVARCEEALTRYGLPADEHWKSRSTFQALSADEQTRVRGQLIEACLLLARGYANSERIGLPTSGQPEKLNELAERIAGDEVPRAIWEQRAELLQRKGNQTEAERAANQARSAPLKSSRDYFLSASEDLAAGRYREARASFTRAVELDPGSYRAHVGLGMSQEGLGNYSEAASCYTTAIALRPDAPDPHRNRGFVSIRLRDYARARADLDRAAELVPDYADTYLNRALAHQGMKDYAAAIADLDRAAELGAPSGRVLFMRSRARDLSGDKEGAKRDLAAAMKIEPSDDLTWATRGVTRMQADPVAALADFDAAIALNPRALSALQNKAHVLAKLGRNREAIKTLDQILALFPDLAASRAGRGVMQAREGNWVAAKADAEEAIRRDTSPSNVYQVAGIYARLATQEPSYQAKAIHLLTTALRGGYGFEHLETDKDLDTLRQTPEFARLLAGVRALKE